MPSGPWQAPVLAVGTVAGERAPAVAAPRRSRTRPSCALGGCVRSSVHGCSQAVEDAGLHGRSAVAGLVLAGENFDHFPARQRSLGGAVRTCRSLGGAEPTSGRWSLGPRAGGARAGDELEPDDLGRTTSRWWISDRR
jgi:hypothetical protein